jgi:hypothetical protein
MMNFVLCGFEIMEKGTLLEGVNELKKVGHSSQTWLYSKVGQLREINRLTMDNTLSISVE